MSGRGLVIFALLATAADSQPSTPATKIQLFAVERSAQPVCVKGTLRAVPRCVGAACGDVSPRTAEWTFRIGSAEAEMTLRPSVAWEIFVEGKGCWASPLVIAGGNNGETRTAFVWPSATIGGALRVQKAETPPPELEATVQAGDGVSAGTEIAETHLTCSIDGGAWRCAVPAANVDLRIGASGFTPRYFWGVDVPAGEMKTIDLIMKRGASVSGRVALNDRRAPADGIAVELRPAGFAATPADQRRMTAQSLTSTTSSRGFFQFPSVEQGAYDLTASKKGWSSATRRLRVGAAEESDAGVLTLPPLTRAAVIIDPALDTKGRRWRVVLGRESFSLDQSPPLADKQTRLDGTWDAGGLMAGRYRLDVYDGGGVAYERLTVNIQPGDSPIRFHMDGLLIRGVVRIGHEPLPSALRFINTQAPGDFDLATDDRGAFAGTFPTGGRYSVEIFPKGSTQKLRRQVQVQPNSEGTVNLEIDLPGGVVRGKVVDEAGNPVVATVQILPDSSRFPMSTTSGEDGVFQLIGVDSGNVVLNAQERNLGESGPTPHTIRETDSEPVTLTLHPRTDFTMWLVSPAGQPVAGAVVRFSDGHYSRERISGPTGDVQFAIGRGFRSIDVIVAAAGFPVRMMNLPVSQDMDPNPQVILGAESARLVARSVSAPPWPALRPAQGEVTLHLLPELFAAPMGGPSSNRTERGYEFELDAGNYLLCPDVRTPATCVQRTLLPGTETIVDFSPVRTQESAK